MNNLIEAAKAVIDRWDSTDWKAAPTADVMDRLRAALSAKPEPLPEVKKWISFNCFFDHYITNQTVIRTAIVYTYLQQLTAAHAAELANLHAQIGDLLALTAAHAAELAAIEHERSGVEGAMYARILALEAELAKYKALEDAVDHELVISLEATLDSYPSAKEAVKQLLDWHSEVAIDPQVSSAARALIEQGWREALAYDPPIPNEIKGRVQAEWFWKGVLAMREQEETK